MSGERREIATTRSWSRRSAEPNGGDDLARRFVESSRRAEIIALVNSATTALEMGSAVCDELCEAFEAEKAFVLGARQDGSPPRLVAAVGLNERERERVVADPLVLSSLAGENVQSRLGLDLAHLEARAIALAPASQDGGRVLMGVARCYEQAFDPVEAALLEAVTNSAAHALQRFWVSADREQHAARQASLARAAKALGESLDPKRVLSTLCAEASYATGGEIVVVYFGDGREELHAVAAHGVPEEFIGHRRGINEGLCGRVMATGLPQVSNDYTGEALSSPSTPALDGVRSALAVPLRRQGGMDGVISVGFLDGRWIGEADRELLAAFSDLAGVACHNADAHAAAQRAASRDALTGCLNHGVFQGRLRAEVARSDRGAEPFTLVLLDLEDFKSVNERFGHLSGDAVLRSVGEVLRSGVREQDQVARFGGDEFALILPATPHDEAEPLVARLLGRLRQVTVPGGGALGAHAGLAEWRPGEGPITLIERADQSLLTVKREHHQDEERLAAAAARAGTAGRVGSHTRRMAIASRVGAKLARLLEVEAVAQATATELTENLDYDFAAIMRLGSDGRVSSVACSSRTGADVSPWPWSDPPERGALARCLRERRPVLVGDMGEEPHAAGWPGLGLCSELAVPLYVGTEVWGAVEVQSAGSGDLEEDDARLAELVADHAGAALRTAELYRKLEQTHLGVAEALAAALEAKDGYTAQHARRIAELAVSVGREMGLPEAEVEAVRYGAIFHDIGKIAVPDAILNKPGPLSDEEFAVIKRHPEVGEQILAPVPFLSDVRRIVRHDHERWDGGGYPDGLCGTAIPVGARIVLVVDSYHAMTSDRPYRRAMSDAEARAELEANQGTQYDPAVVEALTRVLDREGAPV